jgi:acyl carrier protein
MHTIEAVRRFVLTNFFVTDGTTVENAESLLERGIVDSTGVLEIVSFIEESYSVKLSDDEIVPENLGSIASIATFIERKQAARQA